MSSSNTTTPSTPASAARISARSASGVIGRPGPLLARTDRSELTPTISASPRAACLLQVADVPGMQQVEDAVREDDRPAGARGARPQRDGLVDAVDTPVLNARCGENVHGVAGR